MPGQPVVLDNLGGLVATARPEDLPDGASPRNNDCDYIVGRVIQRAGLQNVYSYDGGSFGPNGASRAIDIPLNPSGPFTSTTNTATGTSTGGGVAWVNPANIDSSVSYTTVSLAQGGTQYVPSESSGSVTANANIAQPTDTESESFSGFASVAASSATMYVTVNGDSNEHFGSSVFMQLNYSKDGGVTFFTAQSWTGSFPSVVVPIAVTGISNIDTLQIQLVATSNYGVTGGPIICTLEMTAVYAVISGSGQASSQTLGAALLGLSVPASASVIGVVVSFDAYYTGTGVALLTSLNVGTESDSTTITTSPAPYSVGGSADLWGYTGWTPATLSSLSVDFNVSSTGTTEVFVNNISVTVYYQTSNRWINPTNILANDGSYTTSAVVANLSTDYLQVTGFNFALPSAATVIGIDVQVKGFAAGTTLYAQLVKNFIPVGNVYNVSLPTSNPFVSLGGLTDLWGTTWAYSDVDSTQFGVLLWAISSAPVTVALDYCEITIYATEQSSNFLGLVSADLNSTDLTTLALDAMGLVWQEDVTNSPNILVRAGLIPPVVPGSYMKGVNANGIAYMAYSDLTQGTSQPMQYTGDWCDRITQVGPGAAPVFTPQAATDDTYAIDQITQPPQMGPHGFQYFLQSVGPGSTAPGNVVTVYYSDNTDDSGTGPPDNDLINAFNSGLAPVYIYFKFNPGFSYEVVQVTSVGVGSPPNQPRTFNYFTFNVVSSVYTYYQGEGQSSYTSTYERSEATLLTAVPVPGLEVGDKITVTGVSPSNWNSTWTITQTLNSGQVIITQTSVSGGVATYNYTLVGNGTAPAAGQLITITNTLNDNGLLNGANLTIATATGGPAGSFTILTSAPNASAVAETGQGVTAGTLFTFDPGAALVGTSGDPIYGTGTGGSLTFTPDSATFITAGVKQGSVFFITRNGAVTQPANPVTFTVPSNTTTIAANQIPIGPPNVVARGITFTESGQNEVPGANFYTYDTAVTYTVNGVQYTSDALIVPDNTTTSATFSFPDSVLLASDEIDVQGNNYFNLREIGSPTWIFQYADRMMYGLTQTKIDNFVNLSFDGGYNPATTPFEPLGWTFAGSGSSVPNVTAGLVVSPDFGNSLQVLNTGATTLTGTTLYYQTAYQDFYNVPILLPNTSYSVRFKARALNADGQSITIALLPASAGAFGTPIGSATFTVNQGDFTIQTAVILTPQVSILTSLQLAIQIGSITAGDGVQIDRIEIFPTNHPIDTTTIWTSYVDKFESVDRVTGQLGCGADNSQPAQGAYQILEQLYIEKTSSRCVTQDSPNYEPNQWNVPLASQGVGAIGPNAFYAEEEFSISANRSGLFVFDGGKPMPISRELQSTGVSASLWAQINWSAAKTIWCRFSTDKRQLYVGVPMNTPNFWLPNAPSLTPTSPNIVIMCNFTGCPTAAELVESAPVHTTMFGDLKALDMRRKWSLWQMKIAVAEFVTRGDGVSTPLFLCNGINSSRIYQLIDGSPQTIPVPSPEDGSAFINVGVGQNTDDGALINWLYTTASFTKAKAGQQVPGLGALRKVWYYLAATMEGVGQVAGKLYSNSLGALPQNTFTIPLPFTLSYPQQNDQERVLEIGGQRVFVEFSSLGTGGYAEVGPIMLDGEMDKVSPHRGVSS